jgi:hypothetical protein
MAKKKVKVAASTPIDFESFDALPEKGDSVASYFRALFEEHPKWLKSRSNTELLDRWLEDHPDEPEVPNRIKNIMANTKSVMRKKSRKKGPGKKKVVARAEPATVIEVVTPTVIWPSAPTPGPNPGFEQLEEQIDDCLTLAKTLDRDELANVISLLRRARNAVVWKLGQ